MNKTKENSLLENFNTFKRHALTKTISTAAQCSQTPPLSILPQCLLSVFTAVLRTSIRQHFWPVSPTAAAAKKKIFYFHFQA
jgi:hypothetical protein